MMQNVNRFCDSSVIMGAARVLSLLRKGWSEDEFHCLETVVLQGGLDIVPVVRVLFFDDSYQAGHLVEDLVCPEDIGYADQAVAPVLLAGRIISVSLMVISVHRSFLAAFSGAIYAIQCDILS